MRKIVLPLVLAGLMSVTLSGCFITIGETTSAQHGMMDGDSEPRAFSMNDIMFAQMMIPHHEQAVELASLAETNTTDQLILDLASRIKDAQAPEIEQMQAWLDDADAGMDMSHNMSMPGFISDADMETIRAARDGDFDTLFLSYMIEHHKGAIEMVNSLIADSENPEVRALGEAIIAAQTAEIAEMDAMLNG